MMTVILDRHPIIIAGTLFMTMVLDTLLPNFQHIMFSVSYHLYLIKYVCSLSIE